MKRVSVRPGEIVLVDADRPTPRSGEILVESTVIGVCGSDTHAAARQPPLHPPPVPPRTRGGRDREPSAPTGLRVPRPKRVTVEPTLPVLGLQDVHDRSHQPLREPAVLRLRVDQGGMADFFTIPADRLHASPTTSTTSPPLSSSRCPPPCTRSGWRATSRQSRRRPGRGPIGLLVLAVVRAHGARRIVVTDMLPAKREHALALGADAVVDAGGADVADQVRGGARGKRRRRLRLRRRPVHGRPGHRARQQRRHRRGGRRARPGRHRAAAPDPGPADPHPGQRHLPTRGLRDRHRDHPGR